MRIYAAETRQFQQDVLHNQIVDKLVAAYFEYYGRHPGASEKASWNNSLQFLLNVVEHRTLWDNYLILEYELPYTANRIDCLLFGTGTDARNNVVIVELKQWSEAETCEIDGNVRTFVGGARRIVPHPSLQAQSYRMFLQDFVSLFEETPDVGLYAAAYCHNLASDAAGALISEKMQPLLADCPLFTKDDFQRFGTYLHDRLANGAGIELFNRFAKSPIGPCKRLMDHTASMIGGQTGMVLR